MNPAGTEVDIIGTQAAPHSVADGVEHFHLTPAAAAVSPLKADWIIPLVQCSQAHEVRVYTSGTTAAPTDTTTMRLRKAITGLAATANYGAALDPVFVGGARWVAITVKNVSGGAAANVWAAYQLVA